IVRAKGRLGIYYLENGANQRPSRVVYDREHSAMACATPGEIDWERTFEGCAWFHITGITPAISASAAEVTLESVRRARQKGLTVSFDVNYRRSLWNWGRKADAVLGEIVRAADIVIANEEHLQVLLGAKRKRDSAQPEEAKRKRDSAQPEEAKRKRDSAQPEDLTGSADARDLTARLLAANENLQAVAVTRRESVSASHN